MKDQKDIFLQLFCSCVPRLPILVESTVMVDGHVVNAQTYHTDIKKLVAMKADAFGPKGCT